MARTTYAPRAPKRRIERVWSTLAEGVTNAMGSSTIHTAEDAKTLVRMRGRLHLNVDTSCSYGVTISVAPGGTVISNANPGVASDLDNDAAEQELLREYVANNMATDEIIEWEFDSKAMRKLKPGDALIVKWIGDTNPSGTIAGVITCWFKE